MKDKVVKFPLSASKRYLNRRGGRAVSCIVSDRWLRFPEKADGLQLGHAMFVDVMTD